MVKRPPPQPVDYQSKLDSPKRRRNFSIGAIWIVFRLIYWIAIPVIIFLLIRYIRDILGQYRNAMPYGP
jgi:hypothetical protein